MSPSAVGSSKEKGGPAIVTKHSCITLVKHVKSGFLSYTTLQLGAMHKSSRLEQSSASLTRFVSIRSASSNSSARRRAEHGRLRVDADTLEDFK